MSEYEECLFHFIVDKIEGEIDYKLNSYELLSIKRFIVLRNNIEFNRTKLQTLFRKTAIEWENDYLDACNCKKYI